MNNVITKVLFMCLGLVLLAGCLKPIYNVSDSPITLVSGDEPDLAHVTKAIVAAAILTDPEWSMKVVEPGHILASLHIRDHLVKVDITYTTKSYNIIYKESSNLRYDPELNTIHPSYKGWIRHLHKAIRGNIAML